MQQEHYRREQPRHQADKTVVMGKLTKAGAMLLADPIMVEHLEMLKRREVKSTMMNSISERESLPVRCRVVCDGISRCASQSPNTLQKSSRQQYSAVISMAIEGVLRKRL